MRTYGEMQWEMGTLRAFVEELDIQERNDYLAYPLGVL